MISSNERKHHVQVEFTRTGWRQFARLNRSLGARFIRAFILRYELAAYLAEHEAAGVHLDTECQEVRYVDGVYHTGGNVGSAKVNTNTIHTLILRFSYFRAGQGAVS